MEYVSLVAGILEEVLPIASTIAPAGVQNVINILEKAIPVAVQVGESLLTPIENIIAALQSNSTALTADQVTQLQAQSDAVDAALDAAAKADELTG